MTQYKEITKEFLSSYADGLRKRRALTQEKMADCLHITSRAYGDLERGKYCFSANALLFLLLMLEEPELSGFLKSYRSKIFALEERDS